MVIDLQNVTDEVQCTKLRFKLTRLAFFISIKKNPKERFKTCFKSLQRDQREAVNLGWKF